MKIVDYRYDECGLDNVILKDLTVQTADDGEETVTVPYIGVLHRVLTIAVATKESSLQPKELRFLRTEMGLTQAQLAQSVGRDVQAIGRWERGENPIDSSAEIVVRAMALQHVMEDLPKIETMATWTIPAAIDEPFVIDARDPEHYQRLAA